MAQLERSLSSLLSGLPTIEVVRGLNAPPHDAAKNRVKTGKTGVERMNRMKKLCLAALAALTVGISGPPARAQTTVKAGVLTCDIASGWAFVFGSSRDLKCTYSPAQGAVEHYVGHIDRFGVDIGYIAGGVLAWAVLAPTTNLNPDALAGQYGGLTAGASAGVGGGANLLVGNSSGKTVTLQPLSIEGTVGVNVAAGVTQITLHPAAT